jgi:hypothetical protein
LFRSEVPVRALLTLTTAIGAAILAIPVHAQWQTVQPGGDTVCSDGSPYRFFVHPGDPAKLLVEFEGGGACWSAETCALDIYTRRITTDPAQAERQNQLQGIYDRTRVENPLRDFTHVYIPYCTGDLHWGNATQSYRGTTGSYTIHHRGAINAKAAVTWAYDNVPAASELVVAGCSAGGYAAIAWSADLMAHYPGASAAQLADSAAGVVPEGFFSRAFDDWGIPQSPAWPNAVPSLSLDRLDVAHASVPDLYDGIAGFFPLSAFAQYNTLQDSTQAFFYLLTGAFDANWSARMQESVARIRNANANFASYTAPGTQHCVINRPELYTTRVGNVLLTDWLRDLVATHHPPNVP